MKRKTIDVEVGGLGAEDSFSLTAGLDREQQGGRLGLIVETAPEEALERWGISGGVLVREVVSGSVAADAGLAPGDVVTLIGSTAVKDVAAFERVVDTLRGGASVPLRLIRRGNPMFIGLKLPD
jgi:serine protease Do